MSIGSRDGARGESIQRRPAGRLAIQSPSHRPNPSACNSSGRPRAAVAGGTERRAFDRSAGSPRGQSTDDDRVSAHDVTPTPLRCFDHMRRLTRAALASDEAIGYIPGRSTSNPATACKDDSRDSGRWFLLMNPISLLRAQSYTRFRSRFRGPGVRQARRRGGAIRSRAGMRSTRRPAFTPPHPGTAILPNERTHPAATYRSAFTCKCLDHRHRLARGSRHLAIATVAATARSAGRPPPLPQPRGLPNHHLES